MPVKTRAMAAIVAAIAIAIAGLSILSTREGSVFRSPFAAPPSTTPASTTPGVPIQTPGPTIRVPSPGASPSARVTARPQSTVIGSATARPGGAATLAPSQVSPTASGTLRPGQAATPRPISTPRVTPAIPAPPARGAGEDSTPTTGGSAMPVALFLMSVGVVSRALVNRRSKFE